MKRLLVLAAFSAVTLLVFRGCSREPAEPAPGSEATLSVGEARSWFEGASAEHPLTRSGAENPYRSVGFHTGDYTPYWTSAEHSMNEWIESVDVPIMGEYHYLGWFASDWRTATDTTDCYFAPVLQKLIVVRHRDDPEAMGYYIMNIIPSEEYILEYGDPDHDSFLNAAVPDTFSGMVIYTVPETGFIVRVNRYYEGWRFADASIFDESKEIKENRREMMSLMGYLRMDRYRTISTRGNVKDEEGVCLGIFEIETVVCNGTAPAGPKDPIVVPPPPSPKPDPAPPVGGGSGYGGGGTGTGGTGNTPGNGSQLRRLYDLLFDVENLTDEEKEELENLLEELAADCAGKALSNALSSIGQNINFSYDPGLRGLGGFEFAGGSASITLRSMDQATLFHEMFHAFQVRGFGNSWNESRLNMEVEAHAAEYLYLRNKGLLEYGTQYYQSYRNSPGGIAASYIIDMMDDNGSLRVNYTRSDLNKSYLRSADQLSQMNDYRNYSYNPTYEGLLSTISNIFKDC